jgi:hypothetical protein
MDPNCSGEEKPDKSGVWQPTCLQWTNFVMYKYIDSILAIDLVHIEENISEAIPELSDRIGICRQQAEH